MFRKAFISLVATAALAAGTVGLTSTADAKKYHRHHRHHSHISLGFTPFFGYPGYGYGYGYPAYYDDYGYEDCGYRRIKVKRWNKSHTHRIVVFKKRWVCY
jgi:hypothetical protein